MPSDPILEAETVAMFIAAVDEKYDWDLPTSFEGGDMAAIWEAEVTVQEKPSPGVLYKATGKHDLPIAVPSSMVCLSVVDPSKAKEQE
jgi:hypothetical protein